MDTRSDPVVEALAREADQMIADLDAAIRCRCSPATGLFSRLAPISRTDESHGTVVPRRAPQRRDFLGLLEQHEVDSTLGWGS